MILQDIDFGPLWGASGVEGFFGLTGPSAEYPNQRFPRLLRPNMSGVTFVAKTTTFDRRGKEEGANLELDDDLRVHEWFPKCIASNPFTCETVNAVGLPGPGIISLLDRGEWQKRTEPFQISFMSVAGTRSERRKENMRFVSILGARLSEFRSSAIALQRNISCPNVGLSQDDIFDEAIEALRDGSSLGIPQIVKVSACGLDPGKVYELSTHDVCDGICLTNTFPWKSLPDQVKVSAFGSIESPLRRRGIQADGGYSGPYARRVTLLMLRLILLAGCKKPINAGGGITHPRHVREYMYAGASSVSIGTVARYRWWRIPAIVREAHQLLT